jgi:predicted transcriptional regulator
MANNKSDSKLVRTSILVPEDTDRKLRELAEAAHRPLSWEIRLALEAHVGERAERAAA